MREILFRGMHNYVSTAHTLFFGSACQFEFPIHNGIYCYFLTQTSHIFQQNYYCAVWDIA